MKTRVNTKQASLFAVFILLTLTLTLNHAYATTIPVGSNPTEVAFDSHLNEVFVSNYDSGSGNTVSVISDSTNILTGLIIVGSGPYGVAFDSNKGEVFVANNVSGTVSVVSG
jgi:DNA-binding beta-propeller fold protein YncE